MKIELTNEERQVAIGAAHGAALMACRLTLAGVPVLNDAEEAERAQHWFAGGAVLDRDQEADFVALGTYATEDRRAPETLWRKACELEAVQGDPGGFDQQPPEIRLAFKLFADTARTAAILIAETREEDRQIPTPEPGPEPKLEDTIYERVGADSGQDQALVDGVNASVAHQEKARKQADQDAARQAESDQRERERVAAEDQQRQAAADAQAREDAEEAQKREQEAAAAATERKPGTKPKARPNKSKGKTKTERTSNDADA